MSSKLFIRFHPWAEASKAQDVVDWLIVESDSAIFQAGRGLLQDIPVSWSDVFIIVVVPSTEILLTEVAIPRMKMSRLRKIVPFAIEEYLASDLSGLHLAIAGFNANEKLVVGLVNHEQMKGWLDRLRLVGIQPDVLMPDLWCLPGKEAVWRVWVEPEFAWVKTAEEQGFVVDVRNLSALLELRYKELEEANQPLPEKIEFVFSDAKMEAKSFLGDNIHIQSSAVVSENSFLWVADHWLSDHRSFNLLQPPYQVKKKWGKLKEQWFSVFLLLAVLVGFLFLKEIFSYFYLKHQTIVLAKQAQLYYQQAQISMTDPLAAKQNVQRLLTQTQKVAQGNIFLKQLSQIASLIKSAKVDLMGLDYQNLVFTLRIETQDLQRLDQLIQMLKQKGIAVIQKQAMQKQDKFIVRLVVKP